MQLVLTPELMLAAYGQGLFPMAYSAGSPYIHWICPEKRGQLSITNMHIPRSLLKAMRKADYEIRIDTCFADVIQGCAVKTPGRPETWINDAIMKAFLQLHERGHAHSLEFWANGELAGGLYGLAHGGAFFGESMFSRQPNASKIALVHLAARLWKGGFEILDTQFSNDHLKQFGVYEVPHTEFRKSLEKVSKQDAEFRLAGIDEAAILSEYLEMRGY